MKDSDLVFQHRHAQAAQNSLQNHSGNCDQTERLDCRPLFGSPKPDRENNGEKSDRRRDQAMGVLEQNAADPFRDRKEKHVVAESGQIEERRVGKESRSMSAYLKVDK